MPSALRTDSECEMGRKVQIGQMTGGVGSSGSGERKPCGGAAWRDLLGGEEWEEEIGKGCESFPRGSLHPAWRKGMGDSSKECGGISERARVVRQVL